MSRFMSGKGKALWSAGVALLLVALICGVSMASGGGEAAHEAHGGSVVNLMYRILNFVLMVIILVVVIKKTDMLSFFGRRKEEIRQRLDTLKNEREAAETHARELETKLKEFEQQKKEILEQFRAEGMKEKARIVAEAKVRAEQVVAQADATIERELEAAKERLKQEVVDIAANKAQDMIVSQIKDSDQDHLVNEFIERVEKLH
ncbi:MAG: ATP synthase F0 subunit B [Deltaproteobacteria bacterium]